MVVVDVVDFVGVDCFDWGNAEGEQGKGRLEPHGFITRALLAFEGGKVVVVRLKLLVVTCYLDS